MTKTFGAAHGWIGRDGRWLVLKRADSTRYMPGLWDIPGGTIEAGESPEQALLREVSEEVGIDVEIGEILYVFNNMSQFPDRQTFQMVFNAKFCGGEVKLNPREHSEYGWKTFSEIAGLNCIGFLSGFLESDRAK